MILLTALFNSYKSSYWVEYLCPCSLLFKRVCRCCKVDCRFLHVLGIKLVYFMFLFCPKWFQISTLEITFLSEIWVAIPEKLRFEIGRTRNRLNRSEQSISLLCTPVLPHLFLCSQVRETHVNRWSVWVAVLSVKHQTPKLGGDYPRIFITNNDYLIL
jgi:hypothetical protein